MPENLEEFGYSFWLESCLAQAEKENVERFAKLILSMGLATGHGDDWDSLAAELRTQWEELRKEREEYYNDAANYQFSVSGLLDLTGHEGASEDMVADTARGIRRLLKEGKELRYELDVYKQSCPICGNRYYNDPSVVANLQSRLTQSEKEKGESQ